MVPPVVGAVLVGGGVVVVDGCAIVGLVVPVAGVDGFGCAIVGLVGGPVIVGVVVVAPGVVVVAPGVVVVAPGVVPTPVVGVVAPAGTPVEVEGAQVELLGVTSVPEGVVPGELTLPVPLAVAVPAVLVPIVPDAPAQIPVCAGVAVDVEVGEGSVPVCAGAVLGELLFVVGIAGVVPVWALLPVADPGAVVVGIAGVVPPAPAVCADAIATVRHNPAVIASKRVSIMSHSPWVLTSQMAVRACRMPRIASSACPAIPGREGGASKPAKLR